MPESSPTVEPALERAARHADAQATPRPMPDVQGKADARNVPINKVGVKDIRYPISLYCPRTKSRQHTVARVNMYVGLPHYQKGTHMSRFLEVLNRHHDELRSDRLMSVCHDIRERLEAEEAHLELTFPYFIDKRAPVTGQPGKLDIEVTFECSSSTIRDPSDPCGRVLNDGQLRDDFVMSVKVPGKSLCPCSKEISKYGAHNQRCLMEAKVRLAEGVTMWIEELFELVEAAASSPVFAVLKRPDEKWVTEHAYERPKFVEDIVRDLALALDAEDRIVWYSVDSDNFESIHNHNAYAVVERDKREREA